MEKNPDDIEYRPTNREKSMTANKKTHWCVACDMALVGQIGKCPVCGNRQYRKKRKKIYP